MLHGQASLCNSMHTSTSTPRNSSYLVILVCSILIYHGWWDCVMSELLNNTCWCTSSVTVSACEEKAGMIMMTWTSREIDTRAAMHHASLLNFFNNVFNWLTPQYSRDTLSWWNDPGIRITLLFHVCDNITTFVANMMASCTWNFGYCPSFRCVQILLLMWS